MNFLHAFCIVVLLGLHEKYHEVEAKVNTKNDEVETPARTMNNKVEAGTISKEQLKKMKNILSPLFDKIAKKVGIEKSKWLGGYGGGSCDSETFVSTIKRISRQLTNNVSKKYDVNGLVNAAIGKINGLGYGFTGPIVEVLGMLSDSLSECQPLHFSELDQEDYGQTFTYGPPLRNSFPEGHFDNSDDESGN